MTRRHSLVRLYRWLARLPPLYLGIGYGACMTLALTLNQFGRTEPVETVTVIGWPGAFAALVAISLLVNVVIWYRDDDVLLASVLLAAITGIGSVASVGLTAFFFTGSLGPLILLLAGSSFTLMIRILLLGPAFGLVVWVGRKCRRFFAPDTLQPTESDEGGALPN